MYKLMIVDDEQSIREGIANGIPWNDWGFEVIAQAEDGAEALELISENRPDVILSDIRMPKVDGVELMQMVNKKYPDIKMIILSGYNDFEYLNTAIKNNVVEYLLKPTDIDEFEETFKRIKQKIDDERAHVDEFERGKVYYLDSLLNIFLLGYMDDEVMDIDQKLVENFGINTNNCLIAMLYIEWHERVRDESAMYKIRTQIKDLCNDFAREVEYTVHFFLSQMNKVVAIVSDDGDEIDMDKVLSEIEYIIGKVSSNIDQTIYASLGKPCTERRMIPQSYEQALCVAHQKKFNRDNKVIVFSEISEGISEYRSVNFNYKIINESLLKNDKERIFNELDRVFDSLQKINNYQYVSQICLELLFYLSRWSLGYNINFEQIMESAGVRYDDIRKIVGTLRRKIIIKTVVNVLCEVVEQCMQQAGKNNSLARIIKECVDEEYMENYMSLEYVAGKVKKSATYVSKLFKDEYGCNFSEYITRKRLERSKELLADPSRKIYEIAQMTGYADVSNFIKVFKKMYGISPGDYRNFIQR